MSQQPVYESVAGKIREFLANTDIPEFTAREVAAAVKAPSLNVVTATLSKLTTDKKLAFRVVPHPQYNTPMHVYLNPRLQPPVVAAPATPPEAAVRLVHPRRPRRGYLNPGCTAKVDNWIADALTAHGGEAIRFTSNMVSKGIKVETGRVGALLSALLRQERIKIFQKAGLKNIYTTDGKMFNQNRPYRLAMVEPLMPSTAQVSKLADNLATKLVDHLLEGAVKIERDGPSRGVCVDLIQHLAATLRSI
jgi:hypothetical protein